MTVYRISGKPVSFDIPVISVNEGLTPSEREVEVAFGDRTYRVLARQELIDDGGKTLRVSAVRDSRDEGYYLVYLGGEILGSSQRVRVPKNQMPRVQKS